MPAFSSIIILLSLSLTLPHGKSDMLPGAVAAKLRGAARRRFDPREIARGYLVREVLTTDEFKHAVLELCPTKRAEVLREVEHIVDAGAEPTRWQMEGVFWLECLVRGGPDDFEYSYIPAWPTPRNPKNASHRVSAYERSKIDSDYAEIGGESG